jgi:hypothetical protein
MSLGRCQERLDLEKMDTQKNTLAALTMDRASDTTYLNAKFTSITNRLSPLKSLALPENSKYFFPSYPL